MKRIILAAALFIPCAISAEQAITGRWMVDSTPVADQVQLTLHRSRASGGSTDSSPMPLSQLRGLDRTQMDSPDGSTVRFEIVRDAGTLACEGYFKKGNGAGAFTFSPDAAFVSEMRGIGYPSLSQEQIFSMAVHDVSRDYVRGLRSLGLTNVTAGDLIAMRIHSVTLEYIRELQSLGYGKLQPDQLVTMRIHGVTPDYIQKLRGRGMKGLSIDQLVSLRIHGIVD